MTTNIIKRNGASAPSRPATNWVDQLLQDNLNQFFNYDFPGFGTANKLTNVPVNLKETAKTYEMDIMVPGLRKEDLKLQVTNDMLTVSYEQETKNDQQEDEWVRQEYRMQSFSRSFSLDDTVDVNNIRAAYENGVLRLTLPKKEHAQKISKNIEIK